MYLTIIAISFCLLDLPEVMEALRKAESFLEMTLTEKCNVSMLSLSNFFWG